MYIDTHCHLSIEDYDDIDLIIEENKKALVNKIIISGCTKDTIGEAIELSKKYSEVFVTLGFHPSEADVTTEKDLLALEEQIINNKKIVGVGEIGLDYHYGKENVSKQQNLFRKQLKIAEKLQLPVVIHSRDAIKDTIDILKEYPNVIGDIHCFSGSVEIAKEYVSMGYSLGIGGVVTFKNSNLYKVIENIDLKSILLETDSPYLTPHPYRGLQNSSKYIPIIAEKIAEILDISVEEVAKITTNNALSLFDLDKNI